MLEEKDQGTGRHPHKSTEEPWPHHESGSERESGKKASSGREQGETARSGGSESEDLKEREYRDAQGNIHHHTRTYEEQHQGESRSEQKEGSQKEGNQGRGEQKSKSSDSGDSGNLKEREYRDKEGGEHHHTRTYEEQHR